MMICRQWIMMNTDAEERQRILYTVKIWESLQETRCLIMHLRLPAGLFEEESEHALRIEKH